MQLFRCWSGCTMQNSGSNSKASTNQPVHCSPMKARNFFGVNRSSRLNKQAEVTLLDVVLLEKGEEKEGTLPWQREWTRVFFPRRKKKKSPKGRSKGRTFENFYARTRRDRLTIAARNWPL